MSPREKIKVCDIRELISLVEGHPAIYNANLKEHNDKRYIKDCWKNIGEKLKCKASECRIKWTVLRNSYSRNLRRNVLTCSKKSWYLADSMSFLKDHMRLIEKDESFNEKLSPFSDYENKSLQSYESNDTSSERQRRISQDESANKLNFKYSSILSNQSEFCFESDPLMGQEDNIVETKPCIGIEDHTTSEIPLGQHNAPIDRQAFTNEEPTNFSREASYVNSKSLKLESKHESHTVSSMTCEDDADMLFLKSIHKDLRKLSNSRKRRFKIDMITALYNHLDEEEKN